MHDIETVKIKSGDSYAIINAVDFDESLHERYADDETVGPTKKKKQEPAE